MLVLLPMPEGESIIVNTDHFMMFSFMHNPNKDEEQQREYEAGNTWVSYGVPMSNSQIAPTPYYISPATKWNWEANLASAGAR